MRFEHGFAVVTYQASAAAVWTKKIKQPKLLDFMGWIVGFEPATFRATT